MPNKAISLARLRKYETACHQEAQSETDPQVLDELTKMTAAFKNAIAEIETSLELNTGNA